MTPANAERGLKPPILLIHGAANSSGVWRFWRQGLDSRGWVSHALDLRGHAPGSNFDLSRTSMSDYSDDVENFITDLTLKPVLIGWSMGGLAAMLVAARGLPARSIDMSTPPARRRR